MVVDISAALPAGQHVVFAGFPEMGHLIPMMSLAQNLVARGCQVTYVTAEGAAEEMLKMWPVKKGDAAGPLRLVGVGSQVDKRGKTSTEVIWKNIVALTHNFDGALSMLLKGEAVQDVASGAITAWDPPTAAVCTTLATAATETCLAAGLKTMVELDFPVHALTEFAHFKHEELTREEWRASGQAPTAFPTLLADYIADDTPESKIPVEARYGKQLRAGITWSLRNLPKTHGLLINSAEAVEGPEIDYVRKLWGDDIPIVPVGPLLAADAFDPYRGTLQNEVMNMLDRFRDGEVIYVSFGSFINPPKEYLALVAQALRERGQPFVWSLRAREAVLEEGYEEAVKGFGVVVPWIDQRALLAHPKIGFFLSHMGWNSMLESLTAGKPLIGWPLAFDQLCNSDRIVNTYRMGFRFPPSLFLSRDTDRTKLLAAVRSTLALALDTPEGEDAKQRAAAMGRKLRACLQAGGESSIAKDWVVEYLASSMTAKQATCRWGATVPETKEVISEPVATPVSPKFGKRSRKQPAHAPLRKPLMQRLSRLPLPNRIAEVARLISTW